LRNLLPLLCLVAAAFAEDPPAPPKPPDAPPEAARAENPVAVITTSMGEIRVLLFADEAPATVENFLALAEGTKEWKDGSTGKTVKRPFYDGLTFHRVIKGFMIQGGCPKGDGSGDAGYKFKDEINAKSLGLDKAKVLEGNGAHPAMQLRSQEDFQRNVVMPLIRKMGVTSREDYEKRAEEIQKQLEQRIPNLTVMEALENLGYAYEDTHPSHAPRKGSLAMANSGPNTNGCQFFVNLEDTPWLTGRHTVFGEVIGGMDVVDAIGDVKVGPDSRPVAEVKIVSIRRLPAEEARKAVAEAARAKAAEGEPAGEKPAGEKPAGEPAGEPAPGKPAERGSDPAKPE
jgi:peptidyl-prolyl cis-trans isomerase A (cyclophilin A)